MKRMKILIAAVLCMCFLTACDIEPIIPPTTADIANAVIAAVEFNSLSEKTIDDLAFYVPLDISTIEEVSYYICGSGAYPDELLIIKFNDAKDVEAATGLIQDRIDEKRSTFADYNPEEMYKLEGSLIQSKKQYLIFCAGADNDTAMKIFGDFF